jgi:hypothetical protein
MPSRCHRVQTAGTLLPLQTSRLRGNRPNRLRGIHSPPKTVRKSNLMSQIIKVSSASVGNSRKVKTGQRMSLPDASSLKNYKQSTAENAKVTVTCVFRNVDHQASDRGNRKKHVPPPSETLERPSRKRTRGPDKQQTSTKSNCTPVKMPRIYAGRHVCMQGVPIIPSELWRGIQHFGGSFQNIQDQRGKMKQLSDYLKLPNAKNYTRTLRLANKLYFPPASAQGEKHATNPPIEDQSMGKTFDRFGLHSISKEDKDRTTCTIDTVDVGDKLTSAQFQRQIVDQYSRYIEDGDLEYLEKLARSSATETCPPLGRYYKRVWAEEDDQFEKKYGINCVPDEGDTGVTNMLSEDKSSGSNVDDIETLFHEATARLKVLREENQEQAKFLYDMCLHQRMCDNIRLETWKVANDHFAERRAQRQLLGEAGSSVAGSTYTTHVKEQKLTGVRASGYKIVKSTVIDILRSIFAARKKKELTTHQIWKIITDEKYALESEKEITLAMVRHTINDMNYRKQIVRVGKGVYRAGNKKRIHRSKGNELIDNVSKRIHRMGNKKRPHSSKGNEPIQLATGNRVSIKYEDGWYDGFISRILKSNKNVCDVTFDCDGKTARILCGHESNGRVWKLIEKKK